MKNRIKKIIGKLNISHLSSLISHLQRGLPAIAALRRWQAGQSLIEILLVIGLSTVLLPALLTGLVSSREGKAQQAQRTQAVYLLNETIDAVRSVREKGWTGFAVNGTFHPAVLGSSWTLASGSAIVNGFTQSIIIGDLNRDSTGAIATGGTLDPSSKKVDVTISWGQPYISTVSASLYFTRYLENNSFLQTSVSDFNAGTKSGTTITNTAGGEVVLGAGGKGDWCAPNLSITALDLPKQGVADAITAIEGRAFVGTGENSSGVSFANVTISNANPPVAAIAGTFDGYKTNGVYGETNYGYIATDNSHKEVVIIDLTTKDSNNKYSESGYFDAPGTKKADQVWVLGNIGYATIDKKLYNFDLTSKSGSRSTIDNDGVNLAGVGTRIVVVGSYAYVAIKEASIEMQIIDISNSSNIVVVGQADLTGKDAKDIFVNSIGTRAYLVTGKQDDKKEFFIVDVSTKTGNRPVIGSYEANGMNPKALTVVPGNKAIIVGTGGEQYQVIDISNEAAPVRCGGLTLDDEDLKINGISSVIEADGDAYSYIMTAASDSEFKIIEGGLGGGTYTGAGEFVSSTFDSGYQTAFNRFDVSVNRPSSTDIQFQVAVAPAVSGSCLAASFNFVGPNASSSAFFTTSVTSGIQSFSYPIPPVINPGRCFKYKSYLSTADSSLTPIFYDIRVNYSP